MNFGAVCFKRTTPKFNGSATSLELSANGAVRVLLGVHVEVIARRVGKDLLCRRSRNRYARVAHGLQVEVHHVKRHYDIALSTFFTEVNVRHGDVLQVVGRDLVADIMLKGVDGDRSPGESAGHRIALAHFVGTHRINGKRLGGRRC